MSGYITRVASSPSLVQQSSQCSRCNSRCSRRTSVDLQRLRTCSASDGAQRSVAYIEAPQDSTGLVSRASWTRSAASSYCLGGSATDRANFMLSLLEEDAQPVPSFLDMCQEDMHASATCEDSPALFAMQDTGAVQQDVLVYTALWSAEDILQHTSGISQHWQQLRLSQDALLTLPDYGFAQVVTLDQSTADALEFNDAEHIDSRTGVRTVLHREAVGKDWEMVGVASGSHASCGALLPLSSCDVDQALRPATIDATVDVNHDGADAVSNSAHRSADVDSMSAAPLSLSSSSSVEHNKTSGEFPADRYLVHSLSLPVSVSHRSEQQRRDADFDFARGRKSIADAEFKRRSVDSALPVSVRVRLHPQQLASALQHSYLVEHVLTPWKWAWDWCKASVAPGTAATGSNLLGGPSSWVSNTPRVCGRPAQLLC